MPIKVEELQPLGLRQHPVPYPGIPELPIQEAGTLGAALLGGLGAGIYGSFEEVTTVARGASKYTPVEPNAEHAELYDELFRVYRRVYSETMNSAHALSDPGN